MLPMLDCIRHGGLIQTGRTESSKCWELIPFVCRITFFVTKPIRVVVLVKCLYVG